MKGVDLKLWREQNHLTQEKLMGELGVKSRQTIIAWEHSEYIPRIVELAVIALDQIEACRRQTGYRTQFLAKNIGRMFHEKTKQYESETKAG
jgi:transcriptional regulator with XRE-family HTH domain